MHIFIIILKALQNNSPGFKKINHIYIAIQCSLSISLSCRSESPNSWYKSLWPVWNSNRRPPACKQAH